MKFCTAIRWAGLVSIVLAKNTGRKQECHMVSPKEMQLAAERVSIEVETPASFVVLIRKR